MLPLLRALRGRPFALLWSGQTISVIGDRIFQVALAWWVLEETGSAVAMGAVFIFTTIPMLLFLLIGGVFVDRFPRLWLMLISDVTRGLTMGLMALLAFSGTLEIWHVYVFSLVSGFVEAFFSPAYRSALPELTPAEDLPSANSLTSLSRQLSSVLGPAAGAAIVMLGGTPLSFALDGASFFISAFCLVPILKLATSPRREETSESIFANLREGLRAVMASPWLWVTIGVAGISNIAYSGPMEVALPFLIKDRLQADVGVLGLFYSISALGSILAAVWLGRLPRLRRRGLTLYLAWMMVGVMVAAIGLLRWVPAVLAASFIIGASNTVLGLVWENTLQEYVPRRLFGRVSSVDYLGSYILLPLGYAYGGWAAEHIGVSLLFLTGGTLQTVLIALGLLHPKIRRLD